MSFWDIFFVFYIIGATAEDTKATPTVDSKGFGLEDAKSDLKAPETSAEPGSESG